MLELLCKVYNEIDYENYSVWELIIKIILHVHVIIFKLYL